MSNEKLNREVLRSTPETIRWLQEERWENESDAQLLNRKLEKLRKLKQQGL